MVYLTFPLTLCVWASPGAHTRVVTALGSSAFGLRPLFCSWTDLIPRCSEAIPE